MSGPLPIVRPNISAEVSREQAKKQARADTTMLHGWKLAVLVGLAGVIPGLVVVFRREGAAAFETAAISAIATWASLGFVVFGQWVYCRLTARGRILAVRLNHAAALLEEWEGVAKRNDDLLAQYQATNPRIEPTWVVADAFIPYRLSVGVRIENPGEPTNLRFWDLTITRAEGEEIRGHVVSEDSDVCSSGKTDHSRKPLDTGDTAEGIIRFDCDSPIFALHLGDDTRFTVSCQTIKQVRVQGNGAFSPVPQTYPGWAKDMVGWDRTFELPPDPNRTDEDRLIAGRAIFDELVDACLCGNKEARRRLVGGLGYDLIRLSRDHYGMTMEYVEDFNRYRDGSARAEVGRIWV